jgi:CBS domain-containing protein
MTRKIAALPPEMPVEDVLALMKKEGESHVAIIDTNGSLLGAFSYEILLKNLLPVTLAPGQGFSEGLTLTVAPGISKRLKKVEPLPVSEIMERKLNVVHPNTPAWEGIRALAEYGAPLFVVEPEGGKLSGVITGVSALEELQRMNSSAP